jgi:glycosyltransferase involved in cell wall biosynthesis
VPGFQTRSTDIAIIIPACDQAAFVRDALDSAYRQTLPARQVIVVNDGSRDRTDEVVQQFVAERRPGNLTYLRQTNTGVCKACRNALDQVSASFVVRLDADDQLPDNYLEALAECLANTPRSVAFAYCDARLYGTRNGWQRGRSWSIPELLCESYIHVSALVRVEAAREVGYYNPVMERGYEDWDFYLALARRGYRGAYCTDTFLWYRQKPSGGRNTMDAALDRALRAQVAVNHPAFFDSAYYRILATCARVRRRLTRRR